MKILKKEWVWVWGVSPEVYIETGCGQGDSLHVVAENSEIGRIMGIEGDADLSGLAKHRFKNDHRISIHLGESVPLLKTVIDPHKQTLFFLNSKPKIYFKDDAEEKQFLISPLQQELAAILSFHWMQKPFLMVNNPYGDTMGEDALEEMLRKVDPREEYKFNYSTNEILYCW